MTKIAIDPITKDYVEVDDNVQVRTENGVHYLLTQAEKDEFTNRNSGQVNRAAQSLVKLKIEELESQITNRRLREAILGIDNGWLANQESLIAAERVKL